MKKDNHRGFTFGIYPCGDSWLPAGTPGYHPMQKDGGLCDNFYEYGPGLGDPTLISCPPQDP